MSADHVSPAARRLYGYAAGRHAFSTDEAVAALGPETDGALAELLAAHLLQRAAGTRDTWSAVEPRAAAARALAPLAVRMREAQEEMDRTRHRLEELVPAYESGAAQRAGEGSGGLELVTDLGAVRSIIEELAASCEEELLTSQPGGGRPVETLEDAIGRDEAMLARGVRIRTIYQHTARYDRPTAAYVERVTALGAQVRTLGDGLMRMLVFDGRTGLMAVRGADGAAQNGAALVVREPNVVDFMTAAFERSWLGAEPFPTTVGPDLARTISDGLRQTIVRMLAEGVEDKVIARRLGMSQRTCQRHISEIMRAVGAKSRFQAGWRAACARRTVEPSEPSEPQEPQELLELSERPEGAVEARAVRAPGGGGRGGRAGSA
ncbi:helix-turn-helix transcriptional regulator [Streptomyces sp. NBC_00239]|uniref:helix-turn-helix transcriptional regulator n=1 Tax=Streptomyces sp. NBC_00239 TaxID=2903640 RepID=UPI002E2D7F30|nr:helix-turn-helix transcriptional regulator [Streptomyces sp. NBC_00239]